MHDIHSNAAEVAIWLGRETNTCALAFEYLRELIPLTIDQFDGDYKKSVEETSIETFRSMSGLDPILKNPSYYEKWSALGQLFSNPWWERVWVIQEVVLARKAKLYCGGLTLDWDVVAALNKAVTSNITTSLSIENLEAKDSNEALRKSIRVAPINSIRFVVTGFGYKDKLLRLLGFSRPRKVIDSRDR